MTARITTRRAGSLILLTLAAASCLCLSSIFAARARTIDTREIKTLNFYTERATTLLYEARLFGDFIIVRPATPGLQDAMRRLTYNEFLRDFDEYVGHPDEVRDIQRIPEEDRDFRLFIVSERVH